MSHEVVYLGSSPAYSGVSPGRSCSGHSREHDDGIIAERRHGFKGHVASSLDGPFIALFHEDGADEARDGRFVGEDADDVGPALDLAIEAFNGIGAVEFGTVFLREGHIGQHIRLGIVHQGRQLRELGTHLVGDCAPLLAGRFRRLLREGCADKGRDDAPAALSGVGQDVAHEVDTATLPRRAQQLRYGGFDTFMGVGDDKLHSPQTPARQFAQEGCPEGFSLGCPDMVLSKQTHRRLPIWFLPSDDD